ncbi:MAG: hypothetical protein WAL24_04465, partial [Nitrososphaeraceae archaeon]
GITTFNALRNSGARAGDVVAILGVGGLGHLGIQFAAKMGFNTIAIGRSRVKEEELVRIWVQGNTLITGLRTQLKNLTSWEELK